MENPCKIVCYGDSILKSAIPLLERQLRDRYRDHRVEVIDACVIGETTEGALRRLDEICRLRPTVCLVAFGMNDWRKGVERRRFRRNLSQIIENLRTVQARLLLTTMNPDAHECNSYRISPDLQRYNEDIRDLAYQNQLRICDVYTLWQERFPQIRSALHDEIHPNGLGIKCTVDSILHMISRSYTTLVWQFNGEECFCNYNCPYCYVSSETNMDHGWRGSISEWHQGFLESFGLEKLMFYLSFGEPMAGKNFYSVLDMIASESHWTGHMTSNLSMPLDKLLGSRLVREGRFFVNASYHPTQISPGDFLDKLLALRAAGIEPAIVYVMYPPQMYEIFDDALRLFNSHGFLIHVRRFRGMYKGRKYPQSYTEEQRIRIARFADDTTIAYMLNDFEDGRNPLQNRLTYAGVFYVLVDNEGDVWQTPDYLGPRPLGNVLKRTVKLFNRPMPFGGKRDGTVDGLMSFLDLGFDEPEGNHVAAFSRQGGVRQKGRRVVYGNLETDFKNQIIRQRLNWPTLAQLKRYQVKTHIRKIKSRIKPYSTPIFRLSRKGLSALPFWGRQ
jgi:lysophospholipase L1-like esterase